MDDVRHHEKELPHDVRHLCWMVLVLLMHVHHDYYWLAQMNAEELLRYVNAAQKLILT